MHHVLSFSIIALKCLVKYLPKSAYSLREHDLLKLKLCKLSAILLVLVFLSFSDAKY